MEIPGCSAVSLTNMAKHQYCNIWETAVGFYWHSLQTVNPLSRSNSQEILCTGSNASGAAMPHVPSSSTSQTQADTPGSFTPTLAAHFDENLIRHIQGWPSENTEKQVLFTIEEMFTCYRSAQGWYVFCPPAFVALWILPATLTGGIV